MMESCPMGKRREEEAIRAATAAGVLASPAGETGAQHVRRKLLCRSSAAPGQLRQQITSFPLLYNCHLFRGGVYLHACSLCACSSRGNLPWAWLAPPCYLIQLAQARIDRKAHSYT